MNLIGVSINHKTASIEQREALYFDIDSIVKLIPDMKKYLFSEGFILSTCNRTEIFGFPLFPNYDFTNIQKFILSRKPVKGINENSFNNYFSCSAVRHLFTVASGLDSLLIGDSQILGQMKDAFKLAEENEFAGTLLRRIFDASIKVGKRSIKETRISDGAVTISYAAVQVVEKIFSSIEKKSALVIGAGETGELAARHLKDKQIGKLAITNRTHTRAEALANKLNGDIIPFENLQENLYKFDIIISATSSPEIIINIDDFKSSIKKRKGAVCCIMDIALPRDIDPAVKQLDNVFYNDIDSLNVIVNSNIEKRKSQIPAVQAIIMDELVNFFGWYNTLEIVPTIKSFRKFFERIRNDELKKIKYKVSEEDYIKLEDMTRRMIGRILHNPTVKLRELAESGIDTQETISHALMLNGLFDLDNIPQNGDKENNIEQ